MRCDGPHPSPPAARHPGRARFGLRVPARGGVLMPRPAADVKVGDEISTYFYTGKQAQAATVVKVTKVWITAESTVFSRSTPYRFRLDDQTDGTKDYPRYFRTQAQEEYHQRMSDARKVIRDHGLIENFQNCVGEDLKFALAEFLTAWDAEHGDGVS